MSEFETRFARGEHPDPRPYLERAGADADELRERLDEFLRTAAPPPPDPAIVAMFEAWAAGSPPILELRKLRGIERAEVVAALVRELHVDPAKAGKVDRYYHRLETGLLDLVRVSPRAVEAVARILRVPFGDLFLPLRQPAAPAAAYLRADSVSDEVIEIQSLRTQATPEPRDEVDDLFDREPR